MAARWQRVVADFSSFALARLGELALADGDLAQAEELQRRALAVATAGAGPLEARPWFVA